MKRIISWILAAIMVCSMVSAAAASGQGQNMDLARAGGHLEITTPGTYVLTGKLRGSVYVNPGYGEVNLVLDGVDIDGGTSAGIIAVSGDALRITVPQGSVNRIVDGGSDRMYDAAVYSMVDTEFDGAGQLYIRGGNEYGIHVENAMLLFNGGQYSIKGAEFGIGMNGGNAEAMIVNDGIILMQGQEKSFEPGMVLVQNGGKFVHSQNDGNAVNGENQPMVQPDAEAERPLPQNQDGSGRPWEGQGNTEISQQAGQGQDGNQPQMSWGQELQPEMPQQNVPGQMNGMQQNTELADSPTEIAYGTMTNSAASLEADYDAATYITMTDDDSQVKITSSGTYVVSGESSDGNITVKKGTTGVVLVLEDLDLTSTTGATVSINKNAEVKVIISGQVVLTDNENPDDENSADEEIADAFDGAALKAKADSQVYVTGDGTLTIYGNAKNGIKGGDDSSLIFDGVTVNITAANDGINGNYDVTLLSGSFTISAGDDAIHADHILTVGDTDGNGPQIRVTESYEGLEGTVVNVFGGDISIISSDDAVNAANGDGTYEGELEYSFNMTGGKLSIQSQSDGIDSNGNINLIGGSAEIHSIYNGGDAGIDYDGQLYVSDDFELDNASGVAGPDGMGPGRNGLPQNQQIGGNSPSANQQSAAAGRSQPQQTGTASQSENEQGGGGNLPVNQQPDGNPQQPQFTNVTSQPADQQRGEINPSTTQESAQNSQSLQQQSDRTDLPANQPDSNIQPQNPQISADVQSAPQQSGGNNPPANQEMAANIQPQIQQTDMISQPAPQQSSGNNSPANQEPAGNEQPQVQQPAANNQPEPPQHEMGGQMQNQQPDMGGQPGEPGPGMEGQM